MAANFLTLHKPGAESLWSWFKHLPCLACHMLLLWQGTDWTVELKIDISMNLKFKPVTKKSLQQNEGHLPVVPYCTNQSNGPLSFYQQMHTQKQSFYSFIIIDVHPYTCFSPWTIFRGLLSYYTSTYTLEGSKKHLCLGNKFKKIWFC
jgi:hypothetical protein